MPRDSVRTRAEWPWLLAVTVTVLGGWYAWNRWGADLYPKDASEDGRFTVITYGSDSNPARREQLNIFNRAYRGQDLKIEIVPNGSNPKDIPTRAAAGGGPDILDVYPPEDLRRYIDKGLAVPLNPYLKAAGLDLERVAWPERLDDLRRPNPDWKPGDHPIDRHIYYAVPNNMDVPMVWFNRSLFRRAAEDLRAAGRPVPREPWVGWTWWDYAALAKVMHRRGANGQFTSFGGSLPDDDTLYLQIAGGLRGSDPAAYRPVPGPDGAPLSFADAAAHWRPRPAGGWEPYPNRTALREVEQLAFDLAYAIGAAPTSSDATQVAAAGGFASDGDMGRWKAGLQGLLIAGRWFLGQVRADVGFDWQLVVIPRWVPYGEWERWELAGLDPARRDGAWGEGAAPLRGEGNLLGGRMSFLSRTAKQPDKAFRFLEFLVANQDFNRIMLVEDGYGANRAAAEAYLAAPDPLYPHETVHRAPEHELAALRSLVRRPSWPYDNHQTDLASARDGMRAETVRLAERPPGPGATRPYAALARYGTVQPGHDARGEALAQAVVRRMDAALAAGAALDAAPRRTPTWPTVAAIAVAVLLAAAAAWTLRPRRAAPTARPTGSHA
jgi:ABC-type glycerol-3-phosphate transport system substrate-binding protein